MTKREVLEIRQQLGISIEKFGRLVGVSERTVRNWERGNTSPTPRHEAILVNLRDHDHPNDVLQKEHRKFTTTFIVTLSEDSGVYRCS